LIMKTLYTILMMFCVLTIASSCDDEDYKLDPQVVQMGALESPANDEVVAINTTSNDRITFSWSQAKTADGGAVTYRILFDEHGGDFNDPLFSAASDNGGGASTYTASAARLNVIAAQAGIQQLETGSIDWTVEVTSSYLVNQFDTSSTVKLNRPEGLAIYPEYMYIYGSATESASIENAIAFKEISSEMPHEDIQPGVFESITKLSPGEFFIANSDNVNAEDMSYYYINEEGKIRGGEEPSSFDMEEGVYRVRMDLSQATISFTE